MMPISKKEKEKAILIKQQKQVRWVQYWREHQSGKNIKLCQDDKERMVRVGRYI